MHYNPGLAPMGVGLDDSCRSLPTQDIVQFCDSFLLSADQIMESIHHSLKLIRKHWLISLCSHQVQGFQQDF